MNMHRSLYYLMRVSPERARGIIKRPNGVSSNNDNNNKENPTGGTTYESSDFGENAINNHTIGVSWHSEKNQVIFNYITKDFRDRCTSYESYKTPLLNNTYVGDELHACKLMNADIIYTPYVNSAVTSNVTNDNFILSVGSHYDNDGQSDKQVGYDNNRHDITSGPGVFLSDSIAVSARRDTPELFKNSTSEGYGMEFFEDCSNEALSIAYPNKDIPDAFAEVIISDGINVSSNVHMNFTNYISIGESVTIRYSNDKNTWQTSTVASIIDGNHMVLSSPVSNVNTAGVYAWHDVTLGTYVGAQQESWAVPIVAGKLKVIKMTTGECWDIVRAAARATAKRNTTGIPDIDNSNWDIYRGFGCIDVDSAINFINSN